MDFKQARFNMVEQQIRPWDVLNFDLLDVLESIPREEFVLPEQRGYAYADMPLRLANGGSMLEPKIVARMVQGLNLQATDKVLEIGTGSGYATAVLAKMSSEVQTFDVDSVQQQFARTILNRLQINNVRYENTDGFQLGESHGIYDAIYIGGSVSSVPELLQSRLNEHGGRMVVVVGDDVLQRCLLITRHGKDFRQQVLFDTQIARLNENALAPQKQFVF
ncbi:protein-L-isoaspartate O-methyltransferase family protein [Alysiella filiformis]|uniref:Protein-L-isoaspartate O-methyltransferase n=1 Tax=Alysiella filiformis DSM 16848 TaxID=1120981 RepID=A0A286EFU1_9NEIS|nr:protein-L-isoaspartate O-methyltransferase [Alysiella filiformis]QMT30471.1 protein-L-isoaspartate O-methyltransferase [Alysiella filiformis]UBQ56547.1 protein-L-isoaspartate O-methyltransferase [Alysiella filiformis DSM 16848]SOD69796.1 protein-L-isoaspartate(D-aspartate) O-methyltransferase [Alysiella filiformis DSM 16848]